MSGFSSLNVATSALAAQQRAMDVTGQNIANASTAGYTRQRVDMQAVSGVSAATYYTRSDGLGNGVSADTVTRVRDAFLERRAQQEAGTAAQATAVATAYDGVETSFGEPGTTGLQKLMSTTSAAWSSLSTGTGATSTAKRETVLKSAQNVAAALNSASGQLDAQWSNTRTSVADTLTEANAAITQIADLNRAIGAQVSTGLSANELMDQRDALVKTLATSVGATAVEIGNGMVNVVVGNTTVVGGTSSMQLVLGGATDPSAMSSTPVTLTAAPGGGASLVVGGSIGGQLTAMNSIIPGYKATLDTVAASLVTSTNAALTAGYDQSGAAGTALYGGTTAATISVLITDPTKLAAAGSAPSSGNASTDGTVADTIAQLSTSTSGPDASYRTMITELGVKSRSATAAVTAATAIVTQVEASRQSVSGVSLDEEMTNMLIFKQSYSAAARLVTAVDEMLDVLINKTGLVGR